MKTNRTFGLLASISLLLAACSERRQRRRYPQPNRPAPGATTTNTGYFESPA